jgi:hypothetical protein
MNGLIKELDERYPGALPSALQAMQSVNPRFLLDRDIYDFSQRVVDDDADAEAFE